MISDNPDPAPVTLPPLKGKLARIADILSRAGDENDSLSDDSALDEIARIVGPRHPPADIYQKPWG
jgi:hypothetical protein